MRRSSRIQAKKKLNYSLLNSIGDGNNSEIEDFDYDDCNETYHPQSNLSNQSFSSGILYFILLC